MAIKSSFDLAMERLGKQSGTSPKKLSAEQKAKLAELDRVYTAKIAEVELDLQPKIAAANATGKFEDGQKLDETLRSEIQKLRGKLEDKKEAARKAS